MIDLKKVLVGSDFEMFIKSEEGKFISALPFIDGSKQNPQIISEKGHAIQADGALFEANVPPVGLSCQDEMWENIQFVINEGRSRLPKDLDIICCPNAEYDEAQLEDPRARESGCTPDFNAWNSGEINPRPKLQQTNKRCCGAHLHFTWPGANVKDAMKLVKLFDLNLALPLVLIDEDRSRRELYGKAGCFRFKEYGKLGGVEYRSLSNVVIRNKSIFDFCWSQVVKTFNDFNEGLKVDDFSNEIQKAINEYDEAMAILLCDEFNLNIPYELQD